MTDNDHEKPDDSEYHIRLPKGLAEQLSKTAQQVAALYQSLYNDELQRLAENVARIQQELAKSFASAATKQILEDVRRIAESASKSAKRTEIHIPNNWPDDLRDAAGLCLKGMPVIFVPRSEIVSQMLKAKNKASIKRVLVRRAAEILEDCDRCLAECTWMTKDMREHIQESIDCYRDGRHRAAQSTATIAFDSLLNDVVDMKAWRTEDGGKQKKKRPVLSSTIVRKYTNPTPKIDIMEIPFGRVPFYTLLMLPIMGRMLSMFDLADKSTYGNDANRHMATHMVSSKQYKKSNALLTIMTVVSMCKVTELNGKHWVQTSTEHYGFRFVENKK